MDGANRADIPDVIAQALWAGATHRDPAAQVEADPVADVNINLGTPFADENLSGLFDYDDGTGTGLGPLVPIEVSELETIPTGLGPFTSIEVSELLPLGYIPIPQLKPEKYGPPLPPKKYGPPLPPKNEVDIDPPMGKDKGWLEHLHDWWKESPISPNDGVEYINVDLAVVTLTDGIDLSLGIAIEYNEGFPSGLRLFGAGMAPSEGQTLGESLKGAHAAVGLNGGVVNGSFNDFEGLAQVTTGDFSVGGLSVFSPRLTETDVLAQENLVDLPDLFDRSVWVSPTKQFQDYINGVPGAGFEFGTGYGYSQGMNQNTGFITIRTPWSPDYHEHRVLQLLNKGG